ncbi:sulfatase-like hydrolase/transferase [Pelobium sp.]|nr:sulfatase-like hydrolase/transferase [Pelobium sp.]MDA9555814.1 sulfatase-like hydrolase/transferase [Pelobium sp.]
MKAKSKYLILTMVVLYSLPTSRLMAQKKAPKKPNIIFILTDDLGLGDVGSFFQNQRKEANKRNKPFTVTPYLDEMAKNGAMLDQYCAAPVCAPSRTSIILGQSQGHANVRDNQFDKAIENNYTIGNVMQMAGYNTIAIGKWGLQGDPRWSKDGSTWPAVPGKRGFDEFFGYMRHKDGHEHYPNEGLYDGKKEVYDNNQVITMGLDKCYTGDLWTAKAKQFIINHEKGTDKNKPFMMYLAYDTPHAATELPTQGYPAGFGLKGGMKWIGTPGHMINTASGKPDSWIDPVYENATYDDDNNPATPEVAWPDVYKRYATVTKRIDEQVHDVLQLLKDLHIDQNTLVVFTSDNGPSVESYIKNEPFEANFFESFGPFDGIKRDVWEGGVREPTIAYWPGHIQAETKITKPSMSYDWMPTFTEAAGYQGPVRSDGVSLLSELTGKGQQKKSEIYIEYLVNGRTPLYDEFDPSHRNRLRNQMQMIRLGDTLAIRYNIQSPNDDFELYQITKDPKQSKDLNKSGNFKDLQNYLKGRVLQMRMPDTSAPRPYDDALIPANQANPTSKGWEITSYNSTSPWIAEPTANQIKGVLKDFNLSALKYSNIYFDAYVAVPEDGHYTFNMKASGKAFLRVHQIAAIDEDFNYKGEEKSVTLNLAKGYHHIRVYFRKISGKAPSLKLSWAKDGEQPKDISSAVFHGN